jgi:hypothetical protein
MQIATRIASLGLALGVIGVAAARAQESFADLMARHGVALPGGSLERAFDEGLTPERPVGAGSLATPLAVLTSATGAGQIDAAYAFGILAGRSGRGASPQELAAARQALTRMIGSADRRSRIAGARVSGRVLATPFAERPVAVPPELLEALFALWNQSSEIEQLAAMDALGLMRVSTAVTSLGERYRFYRDTRKRALAGGALEALARIGDPSSVTIVRVVTTEAWGSGDDATALAVAFARERLLKDGSIALIRQAAGDRARRGQALGYLAELGVALP